MKTFLVVEDEMLIADMLVGILEELGMTVVGPVGTLSEAEAAVARTPHLDGAILDVNLRGVRVDPVAEQLRGRNVPLIFATGYGQGAADLARGAPIISKPYTKSGVANALREALGG